MSATTSGRRERLEALGVRVLGDSGKPISLAMEHGNEGREPMLAGDSFVPAPHLCTDTFRVTDLSTGEPIEPGSSGTVLVPHDGWYYLECCPDLCGADAGDALLVDTPLLREGIQ